MRKFLAASMLCLLTAAGICQAGEWVVEKVDECNPKRYTTRIKLDSKASPHLLYSDTADKTIKYASKKDGKWSMSVLPCVTDGDESFALTLDRTGQPFVGYLDDESRNASCLKWNGSDWEQTPALVKSGGTYYSMATDSAGVPHYSWQWSGKGQLYYARWNGTSWNVEALDKGYMGRHVSIAIDKQNRPHISHVAYSPFALRYTWWDGLEWKHELVEDGGDLRSTCIAVDSSGTPSIIYYDFQSKSIKYARRSDGEWSTFKVVEDIKSDGISLALDRSGSPRICYRDKDRRVKYIFWNGESWGSQTVAEAGAYPSLVLDANDNPHISFINESNVFYATCTELKKGE